MGRRGSVMAVAAVLASTGFVPEVPAAASPIVVVAMPAAPAQARVVLVDPAGDATGTASFTQVGGSVRVQVAVDSLTEGWHGFHVHTTGDCAVGDPANPFTAAGGHLGSGPPAAQSHGAHDGDMPALYASANGVARAQFVTDRFTVDQVVDAAGDGSAVIVHALADNYANIPARYSSTAPGAPATGPDGTTSSTGDAGARQRCGRVVPGTAGPWVDGGRLLLREDGAVVRHPGGTDPGGVERIRLARPVVGLAASATGRGHWVAAADGGVFAFGDAGFHGSTAGVRLNRPVVGISAPPGQVAAVLRDADGADRGVVTFTQDGPAVRVEVDVRGLTEGWHGFHVHTTGDCAVGDPANPFTAAGGHLGSGPPAAQSHGAHDGDMPPLLAGADGHAQASFRTDNFTVAQLLDGDGSAAIVHRSADNLAHVPSRYLQVAGGAAGPDAATAATGDSGARDRCGVARRTGAGYRLVAADGGVFAFGDSGFHGSTGALRLNQPVVGMASSPSGQGYWLVARDGGVFAFGDAGFFGSTGGQALQAPVVAMAATPSGRGYWLVAADGGVFAFGDARYHGSVQGYPSEAVSLVAAPSGGGYSLVYRDGSSYAFGDLLGGGGSDAPRAAPVRAATATR